MQEIISYYTSMAGLEWIAVIASLAYVVLAAYNNRWCWPAALLSTVLYSVIFYEFYLWSDSALQVYYFVMALYGWYCWRIKPVGDDSLAEKQSHVTQTLTIHALTFAYHIKAIIILGFISLIIGYLMASFTPTDFPYLDAATTVYAVFATYLVTQKVLENWLYWIVIDLVSIYLYVEKSLLPTAFLFTLFVILAVFGYVKWLKIYHANTHNKPLMLSH